MFISTRGGSERLSSAQAIIQGLAHNGGLFVPENIPHISAETLASWVSLNYFERAFEVLKLFLTDYTEQELKECIEKAYGNHKFDHSAIAPVCAIDQNTFMLELWHGPTSAFKDMALQLLPQLLSTALKKTGESHEIMILVATSGDTGKAALAGFQDVEQIKIMVFYPDEGVSAIQKLQMVTQEGHNVSVMAVEGNFDDAQTGVKQIFNNKEFAEKLNQSQVRLSSANSINWGRLVPQIVYYFSAYLDLVAQGQLKMGDSMNVTVPTGNFGNILAGYIAKKMGLPIDRLICASNNNNVLTDFLRTGSYNAKRQFYKTISPSMDILISSNLERLLYLLTEDTAQVDTWMKALSSEGYYEISKELLAEIKEHFWAEWVDDVKTGEEIAHVFKSHHYLMDPHTSVAYEVTEKYRQATGDMKPCIILSTASPFKFNNSVLAAVTGCNESEIAQKNEFELLKELSDLSEWSVPANLVSLQSKPVRHERVCSTKAMQDCVAQFLHLEA